MDAKQAQQLTQQARDAEILRTLDRIKTQASLGYSDATVTVLWPQTVAKLKTLGYTVEEDVTYTKVFW